MTNNYDDMTRDELIALVKHQADFIRSRWHVAPNVEPEDGILKIISINPIEHGVSQLLLNNGATVYGRFATRPKPGDLVSVVCGQIKLVNQPE